VVCEPHAQKQKSQEVGAGLNRSERTAEIALTAIGLCSVAVLGLSSCSYPESLPAFMKVGVLRFITGATWAPSKETFGILPMIAGSIIVTAGALEVGMPLGLGSAIYLSEFAPKKTAQILKPN
jgi:phosphate transport system permease protein